MKLGSQDAPLPFNLTELDRQILAQTDDEFHAHSWEELKQIIGKSRPGMWTTHVSKSRLQPSTDWMYSSENRQICGGI